MYSGCREGAGVGGESIRCLGGSCLRLLRRKDKNLFCFVRQSETFKFRSKQSCYIWGTEENGADSGGNTHFQVSDLPQLKRRRASQYASQVRQHASNQSADLRVKGIPARFISECCGKGLVRGFGPKCLAALHVGHVLLCSSDRRVRTPGPAHQPGLQTPWSSCTGNGPSSVRDARTHQRYTTTGTRIPTRKRKATPPTILPIRTPDETPGRKSKARIRL